MMNLDKRNFGINNIQVSALGYGAGHIGSPDVSEKVVEKLLNTVLDSGVTLFDTARGYGLSEERIGRHLSHRRSEFVISTKVGYGIECVPDWTYDCIIKGIDFACQLLQTDYIDIVHLHSCPKSTLISGEVIDALDEAKRQGKILASAYSGENEDLQYAVESGRFDGFQSSINICDQRTIAYPLPQAKDRGMGVIAKRPVANSPWRFSDRPDGHYAEVYWDRWQKMSLHSDIPAQELALRFAAFTWGVDSCIVGTTNIKHLKENIAAIEKGPLPDDLYQLIRSTFDQNDDHWIGQI